MARKKSKDEINTDDIELDENGEPIGQEKGGKLMGFLQLLLLRYGLRYLPFSLRWMLVA